MAQSRATRAADAAEAGAAPLTAVPPPEPEPEPGITVEIVQRPYYRATVSLPKGFMGAAEATEVQCGHPFLHENEKAALACGRRIARLGRFEK